MSVDARRSAIIDTRPWEQFRAGHVPGSLSFPLGKAFNTDAGSMVRDTEDIYLVVAERRLEEVVRDLVRVGLDRILGWCPPEEFAHVDRSALSTIDEIGVDRALGLVESGRVAVLDVRQATEFADGHVPGATNIAHTRLGGRMNEIPRGKRLLVHCRSGARSARAVAFLKRAGYDVVNLKGGMLAWEQSAARVEH
jgi:hydroxyacylglutathione hydrolase